MTHGRHSTRVMNGVMSRPSLLIFSFHFDWLLCFLLTHTHTHRTLDWMRNMEEICILFLTQVEKGEKVVRQTLSGGFIHDGCKWIRPDTFKWCWWWRHWLKIEQKLGVWNFWWKCFLSSFRHRIQTKEQNGHRMAFRNPRKKSVNLQSQERDEMSGLSLMKCVDGLICVCVCVCVVYWTDTERVARFCCCWSWSFLCLSKPCQCMDRIGWLRVVSGLCVCGLSFASLKSQSTYDEGAD